MKTTDIVVLMNITGTVNITQVMVSYRYISLIIMKTKTKYNLGYKVTVSHTNRAESQSDFQYN